MAELGWTEQGYTIKYNGKETPPFPQLGFSHETTGEGTSDQLQDLLKTLPIEKEELHTFWFQISNEKLGEWRLKNPYTWIGKSKDVYKQYMDYIERTVKHDYITRQAVFLTALSAYSPNPCNLFIRGPSAIGKTYVPMQVLKLFPKEDVWLLGGMSPTALVHDYGVMVNEDNMPIEADNIDWKSEESKSYKYIVDMTNKILVFLEAPSQETFVRLRPVLSHDAPEIRFSFTEKTGRGPMRTRNVYIHGWPATIFCTTDPAFQEELSTRSINITPEMNPEKYRDTILLQGETLSNPWSNHNPNPTQTLYQQHLKGLSADMQRFKVVPPFGKALSQCYPHEQPRDQRDFNKLCTLIQQYTYFHLYQRPWLQDFGEDREIVLSTLRDLRQVLKVFGSVADTTRSGIPGNVIAFFDEVMLPLQKEKGSLISYDDVARKSMEVYHVSKSKQTLARYFLYPIQSVGWIDEDDDPEDRRKKVLKVIGSPVKGLESLEKDFNKRFNEPQLEAWMTDARRNRGCHVTLDGVEVDWDEFPYKYFMEWG